MMANTNNLLLNYSTLEDSDSEDYEGMDADIPMENISDDVLSFNQLVKPNGEDTILCVNIRSLNENFNKLQILLYQFEIKPIIIVCTESWDIANLNFFQLNGNETYYNNSNINRADGIVVYIKKKLKYNVNIETFGLTKSIYIELTLSNNAILGIHTFYRSHEIDINQFIGNFETYLEKFKNLENHIVIGDFNIDIMKNSQASLDWLTMFLEKGYIPHFRSVTRVAPNGNGSCIDNAFIRSNIEFCSTRLTYDLTDHYPLLLTFKNESNNNNNTAKTQKPTFTYVNVKHFVKLCEMTDWNGVMSSSDVNTATDTLVSLIKKNVELATRIKELKYTPKKSWITQAIIQSTKTKEKKYQKWKKNPNNTRLHDEYKLYSNNLKKIIAVAKRQFEQREVLNFENNSKKTWQYVNNKLGNKKKKNIEVCKINNNNGTVIDDQKEIVEVFNKYFCNIGLELAKKIKTNMPATREKRELNNIITNSIFLALVDELEVYNVILKLKNRKGGVDGITTKLLKHIAHIVAKPLQYIVNSSFVTGVCPRHFKIAEVVPIHKKGSKELTTNYRPISLISNVAKIFEKLLQKRIVHFIEKYHILSTMQFGFRKGIGTKDALGKITETIYANLDKSIPTAAVFLDLAKAFDTVDHYILRSKLNAAGIRGMCLKLILNYLSDRKQLVRINNEKSNLADVKIGVPQGTILGPLLFIIYINDIFEKIDDNCVIYSFADDTTILCTAQSWDLVKIHLEKVLEEISNWLIDNLLSLNIEKTMTITFGNYVDSVPLNFDISIKGQYIERVESTKYLGVLIDQSLKWKQHINYITNKMKYIIYTLYKLSKLLSTKNILTIMYGIYYSVVTYGIIAWGSAKNNALVLLNRVHNKIIKLLKSLKSDIKLPLNIQQKYTLESIKFHYNSLKDKFLQSSLKTRYKSLQLPVCTKDIGTRSHLFEATLLYNRLPNNLKQLTTANYANMIEQFIRNN